MSVMLNNLTTGATYTIRVVAYTRVGAGPYSQTVCYLKIVYDNAVIFARRANFHAFNLQNR